MHIGRNWVYVLCEVNKATDQLHGDHSDYLCLCYCKGAKGRLFSDATHFAL